MQIAIVAAGFTPGEADELRRAMGAWKRTGGLEPFRERLLERHARARATRQSSPSGSTSRSRVSANTASRKRTPRASRCWSTTPPGSSATSRRRSPARCSTASRWASMRPAQLVRDARAHGVEVRAGGCLRQRLGLHARAARRQGEPALRLGLRLVKSLPQAGGARLIARTRGAALCAASRISPLRGALDRGDLEALAAAGAFAALSGNRHLAFWEVAGTERALPLGLTDARGSGCAGGPAAAESRPTEGQGIVADYAALGLTLGRHPLALLRERLRAAALLSAGELQSARHGAPGAHRRHRAHAPAPGHRQRRHLSHARGRERAGERHRLGARRRARSAARSSSRGCSKCTASCSSRTASSHLIARRLIDRSALLGSLLTRSRDFH